MQSDCAPCRAREKGASLTELLTVMGIVQICALAVVPSMATLVHTQRSAGLMQGLVSSLHTARSEAIKRNTRVVLCKSSEGIGCTTQGGWEQGWIIFADRNNNGLREATEQVILHRGPVRGLLLTGNSPVRNYVSYTPLGTAKLTSGAFQSGTFTLCTPDQKAVKARTIILSPTGRPRSVEISAGGCL